MLECVPLHVIAKLNRRQIKCIGRGESEGGVGFGIVITKIPYIARFGEDLKSKEEREIREQLYT